MVFPIGIWVMGVYNSNPLQSIDFIALTLRFLCSGFRGVVWGKFVVYFEINPILYILGVLLTIKQLK